MKTEIEKRLGHKRGMALAVYLTLVICGFMLLLVACGTDRVSSRTGSAQSLPTPLPKHVVTVDVPPPPTYDPSPIMKPTPRPLPIPLPVTSAKPTPKPLPVVIKTPVVRTATPKPVVTPVPKIKPFVVPPITKPEVDMNSKPVPVVAVAAKPVPTPIPAPVAKPIPAPRPMAPAMECPLHLEVEGRGVLQTDSLMLVQPGEEIAFRVLLDTAGKTSAFAASSVSEPGRYSARANKSISVDVKAGVVRSNSIDAMVWVAPQKPGLQKLQFDAREDFSFSPSDKEAHALKGTATVTVMVLYPFDRNGLGVIEGYPVGLYPNEKGPEASPSVQRKPDAWIPPKWFVKVTPEIEKMQVSEHFKLGDFSARSLRGQLHYIALNPALIDFMESLRGMAQVEYGPNAEVVILRGFMSPTERLLLSQRKVVYTKFSRYQYGDAAAIAIDLDGSGKMGDLNRDGKLDRADADKAIDLIDKAQELKKVRGWRMSFTKPLETDWPAAPFAAFDLRGFR